MAFVAVACAVIVAACTVVVPKAVKAAAATLVQVVNTSEVLSNTTTQLATYELGATAPIDVSMAKQIRVAVTANGYCDYAVDVDIQNPAGMLVATERLKLAKNGQICNASKTYDLPGSRIQVYFTGGSGPTTVFTTVWGRSN
jgi:archaellum component FlaF (FlaF/FlaG flagellin family)